MLDYAALEALAAVVREGSFERAARRLHVTPSAISQRVKQLEERTGQVLVLRATPCTGTDAGRRLCLHFEQVALLENSLRRAHPSLLQSPGGPAPTLTLAVNADSLSTWFMDAMAAFTQAGNELLDLRIDDQEYTAQRLRDGEVLAAVTTTTASIAGCNSWALGAMRYTAAASPAFIARHLSAGVNSDTLRTAPLLSFNPGDRLQEQWLQQHALTSRGQPPRHYVPSNDGYVQACEHGLGWGMHPLPLIERQLRDGRLQALLPGATLQMPLFWVQLRSAQAPLQHLTQCVFAAAKAWLEPPATGGADPA